MGLEGVIQLEGEAKPGPQTQDLGSTQPASTRLLLTPRALGQATAGGDGSRPAREEDYKETDFLPPALGSGDR